MSIFDISPEHEIISPKKKVFNFTAETYKVTYAERFKNH